MTFSIITLGCKVNSCESAAIHAAFLAAGYSPAEEDSPADVYIINSCAVTGVGVKKARQTVSHCKTLNPDGITVLCGCYPQAYPEEAVRDVSTADIITGNANKSEIPAMVSKFIAEHRRMSCVQPLTREFDEASSAADLDRTRAFIKIEDGCDRFCTYCIIPTARGRVRSRRPEEITRQAEQAAAAGNREIVLTGINLGCYGEDIGYTPADAVRAAQVSGIERVRLGSLEADTLTGDEIQRLKACEKLCPHFHLSLQSGCDETLRRMNRKYDTARFYQSVTLLRAYFDRPAVTTDLICGFPGETEEEFARTLAFIEKCGFAAMHIFPYSIRPGTKAAAMEQLSAAVKERRAARAAEVASQMHRAYLEGCVGQVYPVLFEQEKDGYYTGHAPNYCETGVRGEDLHNKVLDVKITGTDGDMLIGELT